MTNLSGVLYSPKIWALVRVGKGEIARRVVNPEPGISILVVFFLEPFSPELGRRWPHSEVAFFTPKLAVPPLEEDRFTPRWFFFPQKEPLSSEGGEKRMTGSTPGSTRFTLKWEGLLSREGGSRYPLPPLKGGGGTTRVKIQVQVALAMWSPPPTPHCLRALVCTVQG